MSLSGQRQGALLPKRACKRHENHWYRAKPKGRTRDQGYYVPGSPGSLESTKIIIQCQNCQQWGQATSNFGRLVPRKHRWAC